MELALTALRQFSLGTIGEATVLHHAARVAAPVPSAALLAGSALPQSGASGMDVEADIVADADALTPSHVQATDEAGVCSETVSELYTWGRAKNCQLGFGATGEEQLVPRLVPFPSGLNVQVLSCGQFHSLAVTACGSVFSWGFSGTTGRLGLESSGGGASVSCIEPCRLPDFGPSQERPAVKVAAGTNHSLALTSTGLVYAWGSNATGQLGIQGFKTGEGSTCSRPQPVKGPLKGEVVIDIAAGPGHSLCCTESGGGFSWGSNERGALGLGAPPTGPAMVASPQRLPHLRGTKAVVASVATHVSAALISGHGDVLIFGCASQAAAAKAPTGKAAGSSNSVADPRHFLPSRVLRRRGRGGSGTDSEAWQSAQRAAAPLRAVGLGSEEAWGVDTEGLLWSWSLQAQRPSTAEVVLGSSPLPDVEFADVAVAGRLGAVWAVDASPGANLWQLKKDTEGWTAQRVEQTGQISCLACGPEHQAVVISFRRPKKEVPTQVELEMELQVESEDASDDTDDDDSQGQAQSRVQGLRQPASLQQLCEEKLCREVTPRSFGMLCEAAFELDRPAALDFAYQFLRANAALMFSRQHLPVLSQLSVEILAAFELVAAGHFLAPSAALDAHPAGFPFEIMVSLPEEASTKDEETSGSLTVKQGAAKSGGQRRKRRSGTGTTPKATPKEGATASPPAMAAASTSSLPSPAVGALPSPLAKAASPAVKPNQPVDWVTVQRRKAGSGASPGSPSAAHVPSPVAGAAGAALGTVAGGASPKLESLGPPAIPLRPLPTIGDFVKPAAADAAPPAAATGSSAGDGPSAFLSAAVQSIRSAPKAAPWAAASAESQEAPRLREILEEEGSNNKGGPAPRAGSVQDPTTCSWGRDAMPSEKPKGRSVYDIQQQEEVENAKRREDDEIKEIEAMFAALEVAEQADAQAQSGASASKGPAASKAKKSAKPQAGEKAAQPRPPRTDAQASPANKKQPHEGKKGQPRGNKRGGGWDGWQGWSGSGWDWWEEGWQGPESEGVNKRWVAKQDEVSSASWEPAAGAG